MISSNTALTGLLGQPVAHSLSPAMHNAAMTAMKLDFCYLAFPCNDVDLQSALAGLRAVGCRGLNVTIPHKRSTALLCRELSPLARRLGAVNTLQPHPNGGWIGHNTDTEGFLAPLKSVGTDWRGQKSVVVGCGGSARAVAAGLQQLELGQITLVGNRPQSLEACIQDLERGQPAVTSSLKSLLAESPDLSSHLAAARLVVNTTPVGMVHGQVGSGVEEALPLGSTAWCKLTNATTLYDLIYTPRPTAWLRLGRQRGCCTLDGLEMLVHQGAAALRIWLERENIPLEVMRQAAEAALS